MVVCGVFEVEQQALLLKQTACKVFVCFIELSDATVGSEGRALCKIESELGQCAVMSEDRVQHVDNRALLEDA